MYAVSVQNQASIGRRGVRADPHWPREKNLMCALKGDGCLECKNVFLGPSLKGLKVRNQAARELKLQHFIGIGVRKVGCSQGWGARVLLIAPGQRKGRELGTCVAEALPGRDVGV